MHEREEGAERRARAPRRNPVDDMIEETFPASDAPGWGPLRIGSPREHPIGVPRERGEPRDDAPAPRDAPEPPAGG